MSASEPEIEPKVTTLEFNEEGQYVDAETDELVEATPYDLSNDLMPQSLFDQHYGGVTPTPPGSPIPPPPPS